jgi:MFS family permease
MNKHKLFVASCLSIATASMVFAIRGDVAGPLSQAFHITNEQMGLVFSPAFWAFTIAIFISGNLVDIVGMRRLHILSAAGFIVGVALVVPRATSHRACRLTVRITRAPRCSNAGFSCWVSLTGSSRGHQPAHGVALSRRKDAPHHVRARVVAAG